MKKLFSFALLFFSLQISAQTWTSIPTGITNLIRGVYFVNSNVGFLCTEPVLPGNSLILKTIDGGMTWTIFDATTAASFRSVYFTSVAHGIVCGFNGTILQTNDSGTTWNGIFSGSTQSLRSVTFPSSTIGFICGGGGTLLKTADGGNSWTTQSSGTTKDLIQVRFVDELNGYTVAGNTTSAMGEIFKTTDGGSTWNSVYSDSLIGFYALSVINRDTVFVGGKGEKIFKTINGGTSWNMVSSGISTFPFRAADMTNDSSLTFVSHNMISTENTGATWTNPATANGQLYCIHFPNFYTGYAAGEAGILYKYSAPCPSIGIMNGISASSNHCQNDTLFFSVNPTANAENYQWTIPSSAQLISGQGTIAITMLTDTSSGVIQVYAANGCDTTPTNYFTYTLDGVPPIPVITISNGVLFSDSPTNNQWILDGVPIAGAIGSTYTPIQTGTYTVSVSNSFGCSSTSFSVDVLVVGIENELKKKLFTIYPNPVSHNSAIKIKSVVFNEVRVLDIQGRVLLMVKLESDQEVILHTEFLISGLYFIQAFDNKTSASEIQKLVVE